MATADIMALKAKATQLVERLRQEKTARLKAERKTEKVAGKVRKEQQIDRSDRSICICRFCWGRCRYFEVCRQAQTRRLLGLDFWLFSSDQGLSWSTDDVGARDNSGACQIRCFPSLCLADETTSSCTPNLPHITQHSSFCLTWLVPFLPGGTASIGQVQVLSDHIEKLMMFLKHEATQKAKAHEQQRRLQKELELVKASLKTLDTDSTSMTQRAARWQPSTLEGSI